MNSNDWSGLVGDVWAAEWRRTDRSFAGLSPYLDAAILAAAPAGAHRAVEVGCGAGGTTLAFATARGDADVTGIDLSPDLIAVARDRLSACANARFTCGDAQSAVRGLAPIDVLFSRHGVMFFDDPVAAFAALATAMVPGGLFVFSCFAELAANRWAVESVGAVSGDGAPSTSAPSVTPPPVTPPPVTPPPGPFAFADPARVAHLLATSGWTAGEPQRVDFRYRAGTGDDPVADAVSFFSRIGPAAPLLRAATGVDRRTRIARLTAVCERYRDGDAVDFPAAAWIWTAQSPTERNAS